MSSIGLLAATWRKWRTDKTATYAAALSYYTLFSIVPLIVVVISTAGVLFGKNTVQSAVATELNSLIGSDGTIFIQGVLAAARHYNSLPTIAISLALTLIGSLGMFIQLKNSLDAMWGTEAKPFRWSSYIVSNLTLLVLVLISGVLLVVSAIMSALVAAIAANIQIISTPSTLGLIAADTVAFFALAFGLITLIYHLLPQRRFRVKNTIFGAFATAILLTIGRVAFTLYLRSSNISSLYGAAGTVMVLLLWVYYSAQIFYFGTAFTHVYANRKAVIG